MFLPGKRQRPYYIYWFKALEFELETDKCISASENLKRKSILQFLFVCLIFFFFKLMYHHRIIIAYMATLIHQDIARDKLSTMSSRDGVNQA